jgi:hypothetical protein
MIIFYLNIQLQFHVKVWANFLHNFFIKLLEKVIDFYTGHHSEGLKFVQFLVVFDLYSVINLCINSLFLITYTIVYNKKNVGRVRVNENINEERIYFCRLFFTEQIELVSKNCIMYVICVCWFTILQKKRKTEDKLILKSWNDKCCIKKFNLFIKSFYITLLHFFILSEIDLTSTDC